VAGATSVALRPLGDESGMALLITLLMVSVLVAITVQYHKKAWHNFADSNTFKETVRLQTAAGSGVNIALALLVEETNQNDSFLDDWAEIDFSSITESLPRAEVRVQVNDLSGRLPINSLVVHPGSGNQGQRRRIAEEWQKVLFRLLQNGNFAIEDDIQAQAVVDALIDWLDSDEEETAQGAESSYYQSLPQPYRSRNGPIESLEELLLVKGVTPALFYGEGDRPGLAGLLNPYDSDGKINLNTADPLLLQSLNQEMDGDLVEALDTFRREPDHQERLAVVEWYRTVPGWPATVEFNQRILTTLSGYFQVVGTARFNDLTARVSVDVVRKENGEMEFLRRKVE